MSSVRRRLGNVLRPRRDDAPGRAEHIKLHALELQADLLRNDPPAGDDRDILEVTAAALSDAAEIVQAETLASARLQLARRRPDLVILDLGLPDGSGL